MRKGLLARSWRSGLKIPRDSCSRHGFMRDCAEKCNFPWHGQRGGRCGLSTPDLRRLNRVARRQQGALLRLVVRRDSDNGDV
ncbi:hypothetical protein [Candidatus Alkanophaga liquidiphilum]